MHIQCKNYTAYFKKQAYQHPVEIKKEADLLRQPLNNFNKRSAYILPIKVL